MGIQFLQLFSFFFVEKHPNSYFCTLQINNYEKTLTSIFYYCNIWNSSYCLDNNCQIHFKLSSPIDFDDDKNKTETESTKCSQKACCSNKKKTCSERNTNFIFKKPQIGAFFMNKIYFLN